MFTQEDVHRIATELPTSDIEKVASKAGVSKPTVYRFLQGLKVRPDNQERIYQASLKAIQRNKERVRRLQEQRARVLNRVN